MSEVIKVAVVGAGFMGEFHCRAYDQVNRLYGDLPVRLEVDCVCDVRADAARNLASRWDIPRVATEWESVVGDPTIGLIDICVPPFQHFAIAKAALESGQAVFCEKPVGINATETAELNQLAVERGITTVVAFTYRWHPALVVARELLRQNAIGDIVHIQISKDTDSAADVKAHGWRFQASVAGHGSLGDVGSHVFDLARYLAGDVEEVSGLTRIVIPTREGPQGPEEVDTDDLWMALARFNNGATGSFQGSRVLRGRKADLSVDVFGSTGSLHWDQEQMNSLELYESSSNGLDGYRKIRMGPQHGDHGRFVPVRGHSIGFAELKSIEVAHVARALSGEKEGVPSFHDALAAATIIEAVPKESWTRVNVSHDAFDSGAS